LLGHAIAIAIAIALALAGEPALAASQDDTPTGDKASNALYWQGQAALRQSDWSTALRRFQDLEKLLRKNEPKSVDAALYWEAYALVQAKRTTEAKGVIERLRREFPESRWSREADTLLAQKRPPAQGDARLEDEELADIAVQGLINAPPERALPVLKKVLASQRSIKVKKRALFVLSQLETDEAMKVDSRPRRARPSRSCARKRSTCSASAAHSLRSRAWSISTQPAAPTIRSG
jgi:tetratricopeptide (TPR) repeat protein